MMKSSTALLALTSAVTGVLGVSLPSGLQSFYNSAKQNACSAPLARGFHDTDGSDSGEWTYCQDGVEGKAIFIKGNGRYANMDIDCDGNQAGGGKGTRCGLSSDTQSETAFKDTVSTYGISDLDANIHPYVVFGNDGSKTGYINFHPDDHGIKPLSVMAVVCDNKLIYGIWGDTNGDDGPPLVGEASISVGTACFGDAVDGNTAHDPKDVLYIAFTGDAAAPGKDGAEWTAETYEEFAASIQARGDTLVASVFGGGRGSQSPPAAATTSAPRPATTPPPAASPNSDDCDWPGHCLGATCTADKYCADDLTCNSGQCGPPSS